MRRALGAPVVVVLVALLVPALAAGAQAENVRDDFGEVSYAGNDGSRPWAEPWIEHGESDGPAGGKIRVDDVNCSNNRCLQLRGGSVSRQADLSGFLDAELTFDVHIDAALLSTATFYVEARGDGSGWQVVESYGLLLADGDFSETVDVTKYTGPDFELRFRLVGGLLAGDRVYIDKVMIAGAFQTPTTTTTSTTTTTTPSTTTTASTTTTTTTLITLPPTTLPKLPITSSTTSTTTTTIRPNASSSTTTTTPSDDEDRDTTTTQPSTTTTIAAGTGTGGGGPTDTGGGSGEGSEDGATGQRTSGLLQPPVGLGADIPTDLFGSTAPEVLGFDIVPGFSDAVELIEASWIWVLALALLIAGALVKGIDRRVSPIPAAPDSAE